MPSTQVMITKSLEANYPIILCCFRGMMGNHEAPCQIWGVLQDSFANKTGLMMIQTLIPFSHDLCPIYYLYVVMTDLSESELDSSTFEGFRQSNQYS